MIEVINVVNSAPSLISQVISWVRENKTREFWTVVGIGGPTVIALVFFLGSELVSQWLRSNAWCLALAAAAIPAALLLVPVFWPELTIGGGKSEAN